MEVYVAEYVQLTQSWPTSTPHLDTCTGDGCASYVSNVQTFASSSPFPRCTKACSIQRLYCFAQQNCDKTSGADAAKLSYHVGETFRKLYFINVISPRQSVAVTILQAN